MNDILMNKLLLPCLLLLGAITLVVSVSELGAPVDPSISVRKLGVDYDYIYCQAGEHAVDQYIPIRDHSKRLAKGGGTLGDFEVNYNGFTPEAQAAFQYAVDIWDMLLDSEAKIVVDANFADLNSGALGSAAPTALYVNFSDKVDENIEYSAALAEKIVGNSLNGSDADLRCNFSSSVNWFFDFDNVDNIGDNQYDFVSVVLHELGHGLGFLSSNALASTDRLGFIKGDTPVFTDIWSLLLERGDETNLILNLEEGSSELGIALTSDDLFLHSHSFEPDGRPQIFAPNPWQGGSSLSHLDEVIYSSTSPLMTPSIGTKEVLHDPGIGLTMMNDMGWRSSFIAHRANNTELVNQPLPIEVDVYTDIGVGFDSTAVVLIYSRDSFRMTSDTLMMSSFNGDSKFQAELPSTNTTGRYQYYVAIDDAMNNGYSSPLLAPRRYHDVQIGIDEVAPEISHIPLEFYFLNEDAPILSAMVRDAFMGVDTVTLEFRVNGGNVVVEGLSNIAFDQFEYTFDLASLNLSDGDMIEYRLKATDMASGQNVSFFPQDGFLTVEVKDVPAEVEFYQNDFETPNIDFSVDGFSVRSVAGFDGKALHSDHPYRNAGAGNELNFTATLRVPIKVTEGGMIEFDEVVLVEPGGAGSTFGEPDFWDYVIVEALKKGGTSWIPLADGYDSSDQGEWKNRYDAGISGQNSSSSGDKNIIKRRIINLHQPSLGIDVGDMVTLRWRLFSDPFAVGWGWSIDDLVIQEENNTTSIVEYDNSNRFISIFPNPIVNQNLNFRVLGDIQIQRMSIVDSNGRLVSDEVVLVGQNDSRNVNVSGLLPGVYFAIFQSEGLTITKRFLKL